MSTLSPVSKAGSREAGVPSGWLLSQGKRLMGRRQVPETLPAGIAPGDIRKGDCRMGYTKFDEAYNMLIGAHWGAMRSFEELNFNRIDSMFGRVEQADSLLATMEREAGAINSAELLAGQKMRQNIVEIQDNIRRPPARAGLG